MPIDKSIVTAIRRDDENYPQLLTEMANPPQRLYCAGRLPAANELCIAVVGTRRVTPYGEKVTAQLTRDLVAAGFTIVSGFMYGVDAVAHRTALACGGKTIGVLGFGLGQMYPRSHAQLAEQVLATGNTLLTEYTWEEAALPAHFPARNRIVAGMSLGVVVTEAAAQSGSKITARLAAEAGRNVYAVSGPIDSPYAQGTKELVNLGAKLITSVEDILEDLVQYTLHPCAK